MHPLDHVMAPDEPEVVLAEVVPDLPPIDELPPVPQKTSDAFRAALGEGGPAEAVRRAKEASPAVTQSLIELALSSPNHHARRAAGRDVLQLAGLMADTTKIDVVVSFRALFAQMNAGELSAFLERKEFPERLRDEAMKLLSHAA